MNDHGAMLTGQTAVVTGASSGIGEGIARAMSAAGASVVIDFVAHENEAQAIVADVSASGGRAIAVRADVSKEADVQSLFRAAIDAFGTVDILVNNAGLQDDAPFAEMTLEKWNHVLSVNLTGQFLCAREAVREFLRRGIRKEISRAAGKIICISSVHQQIPWSGHANYATSKGGVMQLMRTIAQEMAPHHIRANSIAPGAIKTPINREAWATPQAEASLLQLIPYGRVGEPADIGNVAVWLASDLADYLTGATLFVDGGMMLYPGFRTGG